MPRQLNEDDQSLSNRVAIAYGDLEAAATSLAALADEPALNYTDRRWAVNALTRIKAIRDSLDALRPGPA